MAISAADVKALRDKTGAGMMDCKKALTEANGDAAQAEKLLKELGLAAAAKRSERATENGRVFAKETGDAAMLVELSCETDFVAKNDDFIALGNRVADFFAANPSAEISDARVDEMVKETIGVIKENMTARRSIVVPLAENEAISSYIHGEGAIGVLIKAKVGDVAVKENPKFKEFLFDCALHVAAFNPEFFAEADVPEAYLAEQQEIFEKQVAAMDKPANVIAGIVKGKMNKHLSEICFVKQGFVKDEKKSVEAVAKDLAKELGTSIELVSFVNFRQGA